MSAKPYSETKLSELIKYRVKNKYGNSYESLSK